MAHKRVRNLMLVVAGLLLAAALYFTPRTGTDASGPVSLGALERALAKAKPGEPSFTTRASEPRAPGRHVYAASFTTTFDGGEGESDFLVTEAELELALIEIGSSQGKTTIEGRARNAAISIADQRKQAQRRTATEHALETPFYLTLDAEGRVEQIHQPDTLDPLAQSLQRFLSANLQFVRPKAAAGELAWSAVESDVSGLCTAHYRALGDARYSKRKSEYRDHELSRHGVTPKVDSTAQYALLPSGAVESVAAQEEISMTLGDALFRSVSELHVELLRVEAAQPSAADLSGLVARALHDTPELTAQTGDDERRALVDGASLETLLRTLGDEAQREDRQARWRTQERMVALLQLQPQTADALRRRIPGLEADDASMALGTLADANTAEAQQALLDLARDTQTPSELQHTAIDHLTLGEKPTDATITGLRELASSDEATEDVRKAATLALGSAAGEAAGQADTVALASETLNDLAGRLARAGDEHERILLVNALGNSGSPRTLEALGPALADASPDVRSSAVAALRLIESDDVDELIGKAMLRDDDARVRASATFAAKFQPLTDPLQDAIAQAIRGDGDAKVRARAVELAAERLDEVSETVTDALRHASEHDAEPGIRKQAGELLRGEHWNANDSSDPDLEAALSAEPEPETDQDPGDQR